MSFEILIWSHFHNSLLLMCVFFRLRPLHRPLVRLLVLHISSFSTLTELKLVIWGQASTAITSALRNFITETWFTFLALKTSERWGCVPFIVHLCWKIALNTSYFFFFNMARYRGGSYAGGHYKPVGICQMVEILDYSLYHVYAHVTLHESLLFECIFMPCSVILNHSSAKSSKR